MSTPPTAHRPRRFCTLLAVCLMLLGELPAAFALTRDFEEYLEIVQEINLEIMRIMDQLGVRFSQGAQTLFIKGDREAGQALMAAKGSADTS